MEFRTTVDIPPDDYRIGYGQSGLLLGSCFAASVGDRMSRVKMPVAVNPFGVIYNPLSIVRSLEILESGQPFREDALREHNGLWYSFWHHGSFSSPDRSEALCRINTSIEAGHTALREADYVVLTLGTAWVFASKETGEVVSNCHKLPTTEFRRFRLEVGEIVSAFEALFTRAAFKNKKIILTVSPVRHLKDGAAGNQLSKSTLIVAAQQLAETFPKVYYFPAYEIMMDELRDYRFYERDMIHPSALAVDYIWERFSDVFLSTDDRQLAGRIEKILAAREHRPFNPDTPQHRAFKNAMLAEINTIRNRHPALDFSGEIAYFEE